ELDVRFFQAGKCGHCGLSHLFSSEKRIGTLNYNAAYISKVAVVADFLKIQIDRTLKFCFMDLRSLKY
ncbi:MAG: hypothetical protein ACHP8A_19405, partial [Terriglobales bacterium]